MYNTYLILAICTVLSSALYIFKQLFTRDERIAETIITNFIYVAVNTLVIQFTVEGEKLLTVMLSALVSSVGYYIAFVLKKKIDKGTPRIYYITCKTEHARKMIIDLLKKQDNEDKLGYQISQDGRKDKKRTIVRIFSMNRNDSQVVWSILDNVGRNEVRVYHQEIKVDI